MKTLNTAQAFSLALCLCISPSRVKCFSVSGRAQTNISSNHLSTPRSSIIDSNKDNNNALPSTLAALMVFLFTATSTSALAVDLPYTMNGDYADPLHPQCERHIEVAANGKSFHYSGTAVGPKDDTVLRGCSPREIKLYGLRQGAFDGKIIQGGRGVDAGDGVHNGVWEAAVAADTEQQSSRGVFSDRDGIRWNDGNKWVKLVPGTSAKNALVMSGRPVAVKTTQWIFVAYTAFSLLAGAKEMTARLQKRLNR